MFEGPVMTKRTCFHSLFLLSLLTLLAACESGTEPAGNGQPSALEQSEDATVADATEPQAEAAPDETRLISVVAKLPYGDVGNQLVYGHFVFPADMVDPLPGLIVIHEWWGLNDDVRQMANRIAAEGYVVLAIDLFGGQTASTPDAARPLMINVVENPDRAHENIRQAYDFLLQSGQSPTIGALGWDFGGGWALNTAILLPNELDAVVIYYGQVPADEARLAAVEVPVLGIFGEADRSIPLDDVRAFEQVMKDLGKEFEIEVYPGVQHAFASPSSANYDRAVAEQAWLRSLDFLQRHLSVSVD
jgi:carboxymethylenebutenolidase